MRSRVHARSNSGVHRSINLTHSPYPATLSKLLLAALREFRKAHCRNKRFSPTPFPRESITKIKIIISLHACIYRLRISRNLAVWVCTQESQATTKALALPYTLFPLPKIFKRLIGVCRSRKRNKICYKTRRDVRTPAKKSPQPVPTRRKRAERERVATLYMVPIYLLFLML